MPLKRCEPLILLCFLLSLVFWASVFGDPAPFYADSDTATWIWLLRHGTDIYARPSGLPMWSTNYPPLFLRLVAALAPSDQSILRTGGLVALCGFLLAMAMVGL